MYLGIDIGGTKIKYGLFDKDGNETKKGSVVTPRDNEFENKENDFKKFIETILSIINEFEGVEGIGISIPGCVDSKTGYIQNGGALRYLDEVNLFEKLRNFTKLPLAFENDANCVALAEKWIGNAKEIENFLCITVGTGIGGAVFLNNKIYGGKNFFGGEFGYMIIGDCHGEERVQIMSKFASTESLVSDVCKVKEVSFGSISGEEIFELMKANDEKVIYTYKRWLRRLATGIYNLGFMIDPEKILIGGGISMADNFIKDINEELKSIIKDIGTDIPTVSPSVENRWSIDTCKYFNDSGKIGAVYNLLNGGRID